MHRVNSLTELLASERACLILALAGVGLVVLALRVMNRLVFGVVLLTGLGCLGLAGTQYWRISSGKLTPGTAVHEKFQLALKTGMSEADIWDLMRKLYPQRNGLDRPVMRPSGPDESIIEFPSDASTGKSIPKIRLKFHDSRISEIEVVKSE